MNVSQQVAHFVERTRYEDLPETVTHEAKRSLLNYIACAIAGSAEEPVDKSLAVLAPFTSQGACTLIGRVERADVPLAAYINAISANVFDYDDTHQRTVIHPTAPIAPALFAWAQSTKVAGADLLAAFVLGGEVECRLGNAVSPSHYARGWHITSTCGIFGAAAGVGRLLGLDADGQNAALANAAVQSAGMVESLGTMSKSIGVGNAARNGLLAALLAHNGYTGPPDPLAGELGFLSVYSDSPTVDELLSDLGERWEIATNTFKPYPTGIVLHPVIDACLEFYETEGLRSEHVAEVTLTGHPLLQQRADRPDVMTGRLSQVSAQHAVAIVLRRGRAGLAEFNDEAAAETHRDSIRPLVRFVDDADIDVESARVEITTVDGRSLKLTVPAAKGGPGSPMSDADIERKLADLCEFRAVSLDCTAIADAVWTLDTHDDAGSIMGLLELAVPTHS